VFAWLARSDRTPETAKQDNGERDGSTLRAVGSLLSSMREKLAKRIQQVNQMTSDEVAAAGALLNDVVERARQYVQESQSALSKIEGEGQDGLGQLLSTQSSLLRDHMRDMSGRAAAQDERARQAAAAARSIGDLAQSIERLASEARLLAVNARIESSRLGAHSAGFEVLASEMQRLSDEVAGANERVSELAARLGNDLPWIAQHARDLRGAMENFASAAAMRLEETERGINSFRINLGNLSRAGGMAMEDILRASRAALSHLQFQDVVAQELRMMDAKMREAHVETARALGADSAQIAAIPAAEYMTQGMSGSNADDEPPPVASGEVMLF
jgi:methyl-accepting chemotaxis protein